MKKPFTAERAEDAEGMMVFGVPTEDAAGQVRHQINLDPQYPPYPGPDHVRYGGPPIDQWIGTAGVMTVSDNVTVAVPSSTMTDYTITYTSGTTPNPENEDESPY